MGMNAGSGSRGRGVYRPMADINVTPMVDVMLVLLIVFMVTAPLLTQGVPVDLPDSRAKALPDDTKPIEISIDRTGAIFIADTPIELNELIVRLKAITGSRPDARIYIRGDQANTYGRVMEVVGAINAAGFHKVALVTERKK
jgi:biopolymer transport protein TolR